MSTGAATPTRSSSSAATSGSSQPGPTIASGFKKQMYVPLACSTPSSLPPANPRFSSDATNVTPRLSGAQERHARVIFR